MRPRGVDDAPLDPTTPFAAVLRAQEARIQRPGERKSRAPSVEAWRVLIDSPRPALAHMARDAGLAQEPIPTVRLFTWDPPAVSLGHTQRPQAWLASSGRNRSNVELVERPTGGGMALHGSDVSVSVVVPRDAGMRLTMLMGLICGLAARLCESYGAEATCGLEERGTRRLTYCLTEASPYAVYVGARKIAGFALRRYPLTWLVQGSLLVRALPLALARVLPSEVGEALSHRAITLSEAAGVEISEAALAQRWAQEWPAWWGERSRELVEAAS